MAGWFVKHNYDIDNLNVLFQMIDIIDAVKGCKIVYNDDANSGTIAILICNNKIVIIIIPCTYNIYMVR